MATIDQIIGAATARLTTASNNASVFTSHLSASAAKLSNSYYDPTQGQHKAFIDGFKRTVHTPDEVPEAETKIEKTYDSLFSGAHYTQWLGGLTTITASLPGQIAYGGFTLEAAPAAVADAAQPQIEGLSWGSNELPSKPTAFEDVAIPSVSDFIPPDVVREIVLGRAPIPTAPGLPDNLPKYGDLTTAPLSDYAVPGDLFQWTGHVGLQDVLYNVCASAPAEYRSALLGLDESNVVVTALLRDITLGGTGMLDQDESATWERARDRAMAAVMDAAEAAEADYVRRGFTLPPLALLAQRQIAIDAATQSLADVERDIINRTTTLMAEQRRFALSTAVQWEGLTIQQHEQAQARVLQGVTLVGELGARLHNLNVEKVRVQTETYRAVSDVMTQWHDNLIKETQQYRLKLEQAQAENAQDQVSIELMNAMNRAVEIAGRMREVVNNTLELKIAGERLKLEHNKELVDRYATELQAVQTKWGTYGEYVRSAVAAVAEPHKLRLDTYQANTQGYAATASALANQFQSRHDAYALNLRRTSEMTQILSAAMNHTIQKAEALAHHKGVDLEHWKTKVSAVRANVDAKLEHLLADIKTQYEGYKTATDELAKVHKTYQDSAWRTADVANAGLSVYRDSIAAAENSMAGIITLAQQP